MEGLFFWLLSLLDWKLLGGSSQPEASLVRVLHFVRPPCGSTSLISASYVVSELRTHFSDASSLTLIDWTATAELTAKLSPLFLNSYHTRGDRERASRDGLSKTTSQSQET